VAGASTEPSAASGVETASAQTPTRRSTAESPQAGSAPTLLDGKAELDGKKNRWTAAIRPLPAIMNWLEERKLAVTIMLFTFLALKVIVAAKGDIPTALGIFQTTNPAVTVIGGLLSGLPLGAVAALLAFGYRAAKESSLEGYALVAAAAVACFFVTPWPILPASLVVATLSGYTMRYRQRLVRIQGKRWQRRGALLILVPCLVIFLYIAFLTAWRVLYDVWLPHEAVTLKSGRVELGYVLSENADWISILRSGQRRLVLYPNVEVENRVECQLHRHGVLAGLTAWQVLGAPTWTAEGGPDCPRAFKGNP
jgi:hypothetical protein